jgi:hypothetical protein
LRGGNPTLTDFIESWHLITLDTTEGGNVWSAFSPPPSNRSKLPISRLLFPCLDSKGMLA